jgi:hypothetical protein
MHKLRYGPSAPFSESHMKEIYETQGILKEPHLAKEHSLRFGSPQRIPETPQEAKCEQNHQLGTEEPNSKPKIETRNFEAMGLAAGGKLGMHQSSLI